MEASKAARRWCGSAQCQTNAPGELAGKSQAFVGRNFWVPDRPDWKPHHHIQRESRRIYSFHTLFSDSKQSNRINSLILTICVTLLNQRNITILNLGKNVWTWTSDLPLECVDHSVRMRYFYNQTVQSPWSNWNTKSGELMQKKYPEAVGLFFCFSLSSIPQTLHVHVAESCSATYRSSADRQDGDVPLPAGVEGRWPGHVLLCSPTWSPDHGHEPEWQKIPSPPRRGSSQSHFCGKPDHPADFNQSRLAQLHWEWPEEVVSLELCQL